MPPPINLLSQASYPLIVKSATSIGRVTIAVGYKGLLCVYPKRVAEFALAKFPKSAFLLPAF
jgi:hypothetical protein